MSKQQYSGYLSAGFMRAHEPLIPTKGATSRAAHTAALERAELEANTTATGDRVMPKQIVDGDTPGLDELEARRKAFREERTRTSDYMQHRHQQTAEAMLQIQQERSTYMTAAQRRMRRPVGM